MSDVDRRIQRVQAVTGLPLELVTRNLEALERLTAKATVEVQKQDA